MVKISHFPKTGMEFFEQQQNKGFKMAFRNRSFISSICGIIATIGIMFILLLVAVLSLFVIVPEMIYKSLKDWFFIWQNRY